MSDEKRTLAAVGLMALILLLFFSEPYQRLMNPGSKQEAPAKPNIESSFSAPSDSLESRPPAETALAATPPSVPTSIPITMDSTDIQDARLVIQTPKMQLVLWSRGGGTLEKVYLKDYFLKDSSLVQLVPEGTHGTLSNQFIGYEIENYSTADLPATCSVETDTLDVYGQPVTVSYEVVLSATSRIQRRFTFYPDVFHFDLEQELVNLEDVNAGRYFATTWRGGIAMTEPNRKDDLTYTKLYALLGDDHSPADYDAKKEANTEITTGLTHWVGIRSKYFAAMLVPAEPVSEFRQSRQSLGEGDEALKVFTVDVRDEYDRRLPRTFSNYRIYTGPLDYDILKDYGLYFEEMMNWGWFGFLGKWSLQLFKWLYTYIPNYGIVLLIFSVLVKLLTAPLTRKQMASTQRMQQVQPQVTELKEKYKSDPQKLNQETMKLYKEMGVNPMGGCLPLVIQMPILIAMFNLFRTTIELRGAAFKGLEFWIADLSLPDTIGHIAGFDINPLPIIMGVTMILQQKLMSPSSTAANPQMKNMPYIMTVVFLFIFYQFPSGLNLYYTLFNIMAIAQQKLMPAKPLEPKQVATAPAAKPKPTKKKR